LTEVAAMGQFALPPLARRVKSAREVSQKQ